MVGPAYAAVTVTTTTNAATLATAVSAGNSGITLTGTPTLTVPGGTASGTFSTTGSTLGLTSGIVLSTGNAAAIPGSPTTTATVTTAWSNTGVASEFDVGTFTFSFIPIPGVNRMSVASVFVSEEWPEYTNQGYSDNFTMVLNGGTYNNFNIATIPGTTIRTDIDNVNANFNTGYYRDNPATGTITDIKMDGATTVFVNAFNVVPGTTYTLTIRVADFKDAAYDSAVFVSTSTVLNNPPALDLSNTVAGTGFTTTYDQGGAAVAIAALDDRILDDGTTISSATITLTNPQAGDVLNATALPGGITATAYNAATGVITLSGVTTIVNYEAAIRGIRFSNTGTPAGPNRLISVVVNDGVDNSNVTVATVQMATVSIAKTAAAPAVAAGASGSLTDAGDTIAYSFVVTNTGTVALTAVTPVDPGPSFNGVNGTGTMSAFNPVNAAIAVGASRTFTATYTLSAGDVINGAGVANGVANTAQATARDPGNQLVVSGSQTARTTISTVAGISLVKTASVPTVAAGSNATATDAGDTITFTFVIRNVGSVAVTQAFPTDVGPSFGGFAGTNALSAMSPATPVNLAVGAQQFFTATYTLSALDVSRSVGSTAAVTNTANATARSPSGALINAPSSNASTTVPAAPSLSLVKSRILTDIPGGGAATADRGELITYTYVVVNTGNTPLTNVHVTDLHGTPGVQVPLGAGGVTSEVLTAPGPLGVAASNDAAGNDGTWSTLAPGASATFKYEHTVTQAEMDHG